MKSKFKIEVKLSLSWNKRVQLQALSNPGKTGKKSGMGKMEAAKCARSIYTEVERLREVGADGWTYYQTSHLGPLLVEINTTEEVKAEAELVLTTLGRLCGG